MKIVKCPMCQKYIHNASRCLYCSNAKGFDEIEMPSVHENAVSNYDTVETLVNNKEFSKALTLSFSVIEWMPRLAGIYWLRLLAKNKCTTCAELIQKGFNCLEDADFCNALSFSTGAEHSVYLDVQKVVLMIQKALKSEVLNHEYQCKVNTDVQMIRKSMKDDIDVRKKKIFSLWSELEKTELSMYILQKDSALLSKEHSDALQNAAQAAFSIKCDTYRLEECSSEDLHKYQVEIGNILQQSEQAKDAIESMRVEHPWVKSFQLQVKKRDEQIQQITNEISSLKIYEATIQQTIDEIERIGQIHRTAIQAVDAYNFMEVAALLGKDRYNKVLRGIGLYVNA